MQINIDNIINLIKRREFKKLVDYININPYIAKLIIPCKNTSKSLLQLIIDEIEEEDEEDLFIPIISTLLKHGTDVDYCDDISESPIFELIDIEKPTLLKKILSYNANLNILNDENETPLIRAVMSNCLETTTIILDFADEILINKAGSFLGKTPLGFALFRYNLDLIDILLKHKANLYEIDNEGEETIKSISDDLNINQKLKINEIIKKHTTPL